MEKRKTTGGRSEPLAGGEAAGPGYGGDAGSTVRAAGATGASGGPDISAGVKRSGQSAHGNGAPGGQPRAGILRTVQEKATEQLASQKGRATGGLDAIAQAVRQSTGQMRSDQHDTVAQYVDKAAEQLERLSGALKAKDVNELLRDAQRLARRQPALFIGGSFAVGLLAARFLKSSPDDGSTSMRYEREAY